MKDNSSTDPRTGWFASRTLVGLLVLAGMFVLAVQLHRVLSDSFRIELFGIEILSVERFESSPIVETQPRSVRRPAPPAPPVPGCTCLPPPPLPSYSSAAEAPDVFVVTEQMPELIGGLGGLQSMIRYPEAAKRAGIEGRVITQFVVDECGCISDPVVVRGIGGGCDEEALRVTNMLRFKPGRQRGKPVKVKMSLPITFKMP